MWICWFHKGISLTLLSINLTHIPAAPSCICVIDEINTTLDQECVEILSHLNPSTFWPLLRAPQVCEKVSQIQLMPKLVCSTLTAQRNNDMSLHVAHEHDLSNPPASPQGRNVVKIVLGRLTFLWPQVGDKTVAHISDLCCHLFGIYKGTRYGWGPHRLQFIVLSVHI